ncbi:tetratricopeptide repeat protein [Telmatobacter bradus]|uniref:tetratricopeptide repeat protein n=1 Tax=Telmatobacter bradus TaxID=474953 RepID=UPI003B43A4EF
MRNRIVWAAMLAVVLFSAPRPAHAVSKEMVQLQTQVQQLLDMVQRLQSTMDTKFGVLQNLAQQTTDQSTQMNTTISTLQQKLNALNDADGGKIDGVSGQIQSLNDSVDELKTRITKLDKTMQDLQGQLQNNNQQPPANGQMPGMPAASAPAPAGGNTPATPAPAASAAQNGTSAPPLQDTYQAAVRDFNSARYSLASSEFQDVVHYYPTDDLAGAAQFYEGEIAYQQKNYQDAITAYNNVLEGFSGIKQAPAAQLHKGLALLALNKHDAGVHELRSLIQRHPQTPEAQHARSKLNGLGVKIVGK